MYKVCVKIPFFCVSISSTQSYLIVESDGSAAGQAENSHHVAGREEDPVPQLTGGREREVPARVLYQSAEHVRGRHLQPEVAQTEADDERELHAADQELGGLAPNEPQQLGSQVYGRAAEWPRHSDPVPGELAEPDARVRAV